MAMLGGFFFRGSLAPSPPIRLRTQVHTNRQRLRCIAEQSFRCPNPGKENGLRAVGAKVHGLEGRSLPDRIWSYDLYRSIPISDHEEELSQGSDLSGGRNVPGFKVRVDGFEGHGLVKPTFIGLGRIVLGNTTPFDGITVSSRLAILLEEQNFAIP